MEGCREDSDIEVIDDVERVPCVIVRREGGNKVMGVS